MVLIQPPPGWRESAGEATPAAATNSTPAPAKLQPPVAEPVIAPPTIAPAAAAQSFYEVGDLSGIDLETPAGMMPLAEMPVATVERWGRRVVWGSVGGSLAIVAASVVWSLWPGGDEPVASVTPQVATAKPQAEIETSPPDEEVAGEAPLAIVANKPEVEADPPAAESAPEPALPELPPQADPPVPVAEKAQEAAPSPAEAVVSNDTPPLPVVDPRDLDPEDLDLILRRNPTESSPPAAVNHRETPPAVPDVNIGDGGEVAALANLERNLAAAAKDAAPDTVRRGPTSAEELQPADVDELLTLTLPEIDVPPLPLHRAVAMLTELTAIPITLDPAALRMAGVGMEHQVVIRGENVTTAELVRSTLAAAKLQYEQRGNQLVVIRAQGDKLENRNYQVADLLAPGAADATEFATWIQELVAPQSWAGQGEAGQLKVEGNQLAVTQTQSIHYDALIFCERLRKARGLPLQSRYPAALLRTGPLETALAPQLDRKTTFSFVTWTPLPEVFRHWQERAGLVILVDWAALADVQLTPASTIACAVEGVTWREALDEVLTPLGLAWTPVDGKTIQITSRAAAESLECIEFYPFANPSDAERHVAELSAGLPSDGKVVFDAASRALIVRTNARGHRYIATQLALASDER